jgi:hypothetical protein
MKLNVGGIESFIRIFSGVCLLYGALYGVIGSWGFAGVILVLTGLARFCPLTTLLGINTNSCKTEAGH